MSKIAVPLADDFEDDEFSISVGRLAEAHHEVVVIGVTRGRGGGQAAPGPGRDRCRCRQDRP